MTDDSDPLVVKVRVRLCGCDDTTQMDFTCSPSEFDFLRWLQQQSKRESTYGCQPVLIVEERA